MSAKVIQPVVVIVQVTMMFLRFLQAGEAVAVVHVLLLLPV